MKSKMIIVFCVVLTVMLAIGCGNVEENDGVINVNEVQNEEMTESIEMTELGEYVDEDVYLDEIVKSPAFDVYLLGVEEYTEYVGEKFTDEATDGEVYVVVYLEINNKTKQNDYFDYNKLYSKLDGEKVETTYMVNDPKEYKSILTHLPKKTETQGYLVYQVPEDWKNIDITYVGWEDTELSFKVTSDNLGDVEIFGSKYRVPYKGAGD